MAVPFGSSVEVANPILSNSPETAALSSNYAWDITPKGPKTQDRMRRRG
jgi:hypothetical protein